MIDPVHRVIRVSEQGVGEAGLQEVHGEEGGDGDNLMEQDVDTLPVPDVLPGALLTQSQEAGGGQGQELLESVLDVIMTSEAEQAAQQLVDGCGQAVNVVTVTLQLSLGQRRVIFYACYYIFVVPFAFLLWSNHFTPGNGINCLSRTQLCHYQTLRSIEI